MPNEKLEAAKKEWQAAALAVLPLLREYSKIEPTFRRQPLLISIVGMSFTDALLGAPSYVAKGANADEFARLLYAYYDSFEQCVNAYFDIPIEDRAGEGKPPERYPNPLNMTFG